MSWFAGLKCRVWGAQAVPAHDLTGMPAVLIGPAQSDQQYQLPVLFGRMYDSFKFILSGDALRSLEDAWYEYARRSLIRAGAVVHPLRVAAETVCAAARAVLVTWTMTVTAHQHRPLMMALARLPTQFKLANCRCEHHGAVRRLRPHLRCASARLTLSTNHSSLAWFSIQVMPVNVTGFKLVLATMITAAASVLSDSTPPSHTQAFCYSYSA